MKSVALIFLTLIVWVGSAIAFQNAEGHCGTARFIEHRRAPSSTPKVAHSIYPSCAVEFYYDSIYTKETEHFQIFYTLTGPHKTTTAFVDSVAKNSEYAFKHHTVNMGMRPPLGISKTHHFQQEVIPGLYPVEIIDIDMLRNSLQVIGEICHGCFGLTLPDANFPEKSELIIDNDFKYTPSWNVNVETISKNGKDCTYPIASQELHNIAHDYSYAKQWASGIKVTVIHELYHAVQARYLDLFRYSNFWIEASAAGIEEISVPEIDDYQNYIPSMAKNVGTPFDRLTQPYGAGIFFIYLHNFVHKKADKFIWENYEKAPESNFQEQLKAFAKTKKISADSLFQDFAIRLSLAGDRSHFADSSDLICSDEKSWTSFTHIQTDEQNKSFQPAVNELAYKFYSGGIPQLDNFKGKGSALLYSKESIQIRHFHNDNDVHEILAEAKSSNDSITWVFSNFSSEETFSPIIADDNLRAYPTPWRNGFLCFAPLPQNKDFIEIRNRRGNLVSREKYDGITYCIDENRVKELMAPGIYRYRVGNSGKTKDLMIIY